MSTFQPLDVLRHVEEDISAYEEYTADIQSGGSPRASALEAIPIPAKASYGPLAILSAILWTQPQEEKQRWPILETQNAYARCWKRLPEEAKSGNAPAWARELLDTTLTQCQQSYTSLLDLFHPSDTEAILDPESGRSIQHGDLISLACDFGRNLHAVTGPRKPVVSIALPNGSLLATTILATTPFYTIAPLAHGTGVGPDQFKADVLQSGAGLLLVSASDTSHLRLHGRWLTDAGIDVLLVEFTSTMRLRVRKLDLTLPTPSKDLPSIQQPNDTAIVLFTSGTSGTKKSVPLSVHSLVCGVAMVAQSWHLTPSSRCLNQMPLHHVGGLVRNLFAPIFTGGSVICCTGFDANLFWDCVEDFAHLPPTWYYASPSMHQCILDAGEERPDALKKSQINLVCNAAGALLPSLASRLQDTFRCRVLPSYGMTECMPISTPHIDYDLGRPGTSGISVGPEIAILDEKDQPSSGGGIGRIAVRGQPAFAGYLKNGAIDTSCFTASGWFDTGDMGYLDADSYLFITGRSKEVINRGGELISPFEVEEAVVASSNDPHSPIHNRVDKALAFSIRHDVLQEVVGICITTPEGRQRTCLHDIQLAMRKHLSQVKVPFFVVFMDGGLPTNNNKILRVGLADRLSLPEVTDATPASERHYEAMCPPQNTALSVQIPCQPLILDVELMEAACRAVLPRPHDLDFHIKPGYWSNELFLAPRTMGSVFVSPDVTLIERTLNKNLPRYQIPTKTYTLQRPLPRRQGGSVDETALDQLLSDPTKGLERPDAGTSTEKTIASIFSQVLNLPQQNISRDSDFFELGGHSMTAGRLLSLLRREFHTRLTIEVLFLRRTVGGVAQHIEAKERDNQRQRLSEDDSQAGGSAEDELLPGCEKTFSSTHPVQLIVHLIPLCMIYPMKRSFTWTAFMYALSWCLGLRPSTTVPGRLLSLVCSIFVAGFATRLVAPSMAILFKWIVIGRYREGIHPMWSRYHTRWWLCQKAIQIGGLGLFGTFNWTRILYYRALGAKIGKNVTINKGATLGEYDLLELGDGVNLERCIVRPFAAERNTSMYLGRIVLGHNCSVGLGSIVAAGTTLPSNTCIGPNSSSWEVEDAGESNRDLAANAIPSPHWLLKLLLGLPLQLCSGFIGAIPWLGCLTALVLYEPTVSRQDALISIIVWFASPDRIGLHYAALAAKVSLGPVFFFTAVLAIKKVFDLICGPLPHGPAGSFSQMTKFRRHLLRTMMPAPRLSDLTELFGSHYESTSVFMRALGAKVGKRVYWPGTGPSIQDFDLLDVGDNVVFGSRSHLVTSDGNGSEKIRIENGAMVADRVVLLPGVTLGEGAVMGSGALTRRNVEYPAETTWVGSKKGDALCLSSPPTKEKGALAGFATPATFNSSSTTLNQNHLTTSGLAQSNLHGLERHLSVAQQEGHSSSARSSMTLSRDRDSLTEKNTAVSSPFGRAFYQRKAPYRVWSQYEITLYSSLITIGTALYWNMGSVSGVQILGYLMTFQRHLLPALSLTANSAARPLAFYGLFLIWTILVTTVQSLLVLLSLIAAKWILMGRRKPGCYSWDLSSYCQRWQLYLKLETLRRHCYGGNGILGLLTGSHWIVLYFRALGGNIGKDCALFAGGLPSLLFTEPDLLTLGDHVAVDDTSVVAHINTRGKFDLNSLSIGARSVLRSGSRLLSGARMEEDACLLEHSLVMAGDIVEAGSTIQGWPGEEFRGARMPTMKARRVWGV